MKMIQCPNGHFYDSEKALSCPYCNGSSQSIGKTTGFDQISEGSSFNTSKTLGMDYVNNNFDSYEIGKTVALDAVIDEDDIGKTVALFQQSYETKIDPVVGWLVCISGKSKGLDYKIHSDNNFIGRSKSMDICISDDNTISRENHAIISFDTKYNKFYFSPGEGRAIVRINEKSIFSTIELNDYDVIEIGETVLMFVSFCSDKFRWS